jgi:hypothetical protein
VKVNWSGNLTIKAGTDEESYMLDSIDIERDTKNTLNLKVISKNEKVKVIIPLSHQECKNFAGELIRSL